MKQIVVIIGLLSWFTFAGFAQQEKQKQGRLEALKIGYLTKKLNLSIEEAQKFWPIYNKYVQELGEVRRQHRNLDVIDLEEKVINIRKRYKNEFTHALPGERVNQFFKVDKEFNNYVQRELQERRDLNQMRQQKATFSAITCKHANVRMCELRYKSEGVKMWDCNPTHHSSLLKTVHRRLDIMIK